MQALSARRHRLFACLCHFLSPWQVCTPGQLSGGKRHDVLRCTSDIGHCRLSVSLQALLPVGIQRPAAFQPPHGRHQNSIRVIYEPA